MILGFMTHFPNGKPTYFFQKITKGFIIEKTVKEGFFPKVKFSDVYKAINNALDSPEQYWDLVEKNTTPETQDKTKIHTLRKDKGNRWSKGTKIHFSLWNRTPRQICFGVLPCTGTQRVVVVPEAKEITLIDPSEKFGMRQIEDIEQFAKNDGFDSVEDFWEYFDKPEAYTIIHWTDFKY